MGAHDAGDELFFALGSLNLAARHLNDAGEREQYAREYYTTALGQHNDSALCVGAYWQALAALHDRQDYQEATRYGQESLRLAEKFSNYHTLCFTCAEVLAVIAIEQGDFEEAHELLMKGLRAGEAIGTRRGILEAYLQLGRLYLKLEDAEQAIDYILQSLAMGLEMRVRLSLLKAILLLGKAHIQLGDDQMAVELLTAVAEDPVSTLAVGPRKMALDVLAVLEDRMPATEYKMAVERGAILNVETFAAELVHPKPQSSGNWHE